MLETLNHLFGTVCGQNPEHTWAPGVILLPCCQRCLGLYAGAFVAALLHWTRRPKLTGRFLEAHGAFLLLMVPFGFHWLPQGSVVRTISGVLFGFGVVTFLRLPLAARRVPRPRAAPGVGAYAITLAATLVLVPLLAGLGGQVAAYGLSGLALGGAATLGVLVVVNLFLGLAGAIRFVGRLTLVRTQA